MIDLLVERSAGGGPWMAHWVGGPGCCWIEKTLARAGTGGSVAAVKVPTRYPNDDPAERWTLAKVVRRQAEHLWERLGTVERDVGALRRSP